MDRVRPLAVLLLAACGCSTTDQQAFKKSLSDTFVPAPPPPATEFACMWNNRIQHLPDPTRNGSPVPGLAGHALVYGPDMKTTDVTGDLTITVHDATPRPAGQPPMRSEVWHFTNDTLKNMVSVDERYGKSLVMFVPWPETWRDVNRVFVQARYDQPGGKVLFAQPATVTLDTNAPAGPGAPAGGMAFQSVGDPAILVRQARAATATPQHQMPQYQPATAGGFPPPPYYVPQGAPVQPVQQVGGQVYAPATTGGYPQMPAYQQMPSYQPQPPAGYQMQPPAGYQPPQQPVMPANLQMLPAMPPTAPQVPYMPNGGPGVFQPPPQHPADAGRPPAPPDRIFIPR